VKPELADSVRHQLERRNAVLSAGTLLLVEFTTLPDYLHLLQGAAQSLAEYGSTAMLYLAAAVSDFYIPASDLASRSTKIVLKCRNCRDAKH